MSSIIKVNNIQDQDGNNIINENGDTITIGASGDTITVPSGATFDASNATTTLPANVVTTDGTQTLTNKTINASQLVDASVSNAKLTNSSITLNGNSVSLGGSASIASGMFRNIIINGDMSIAQRGTSESGVTGSGYYTCDRWRTGIGLGTWTISQDTDVPTGQGFAKSMKIDCTTAVVSPSSNDFFQFLHKVEGQNLQYLKKGTANAESLTASFWVKSNKTGTYILELDDNDNARSISQSYTINSANTWEKKTLTFDGDTIGTLDNDNGESFRILFWLAAGTNFSSGTLQTSWQSTVNANRAVGQVNLADDTANEWYITGVQLEAGTTASDFEFLPYDVNLARCQRYYYLHASHNRSGSETIGIGTYYSSSDMRAVVFFPTEMRTRPSIDVETVTDGYQMRRNGGFDNFDDFEIAGNVGFSSACIRNGSDASGTAGQSGHLFTNVANAFLAFDSEL